MDVRDTASDDSDSEGVGDAPVVPMDGDFGLSLSDHEEEDYA